MSLFTIPFRVGPSHYSLIVALSDENIARIRQYDPAEVTTLDIVKLAGDPYPSLTLKDVIITYVTPEDIATVTTLLEEGRSPQALRHLTRGWQYRPDQGDGGPLTLL